MATLSEYFSTTSVSSLIPSINRGISAAVARRLEELPNHPLTPEQKTNLEALQSARAYCVITGQQPGLLLGPLFTLYKAASAIMVARSAAKRLGRPVVPIFWVQAEDHDVDEVNSFTYRSQDGGLERFRMPIAETSASHLPLSEIPIRGVSELLSKLQIQPDTLGEQISKFYSEGATLTDSFASALSWLFASSGLLVFSLGTASLAEETKPIYRAALSDHREIERILEQQTLALSSNGISSLVALRPGSPLFFLRASKADGSPLGRYRLVPHPFSSTGFKAASENSQDQSDAGCWRLEGDSQQLALTEAELLDLINQAPLRFSTSALLRPIVQDSLFPNIITVAGASEMLYLQQTTPLYSHFKLHQPTLVQRFGASLIEPKAKRLVEQLGIGNLTDFLSNPQQFLAHLFAINSPEEFSFLTEQKLSVFEQEIRQLIVDIPTMNGQLAKASEKLRRTVQGLNDAYKESFRAANSVATERVDKLLELIRPDGIAQERLLSAFPYLIKHGNHLLEQLLEANCEDQRFIYL